MKSFDCGRESVKKFFREEAQDYQDELFGKTYYWVHRDRPTEVVAGFTVANASIFTKRLPNARQKKIGREAHHEKGLIRSTLSLGSSKNYPSILLAQLGVDQKYRGFHLGPQIIDFVMQWFTSPDNKSAAATSSSMPTTSPTCWSSTSVTASDEEFKEALMATLNLKKEWMASVTQREKELGIQ